MRDKGEREKKNAGWYIKGESPRRRDVKPEQGARTSRMKEGSTTGEREEKGQVIVEVRKFNDKQLLLLSLGILINS